MPFADYPANERKQAQKELSESNGSHYLHLYNNKIKRPDSYYKSNRKYPRLFVDNDFFKTLPNNDYALSIAKKAFIYKQKLIFDEAANKITTVYYDNNNRLAYVDIYYTSGYFEDSAFIYNIQGNLIKAAQGGGGNKKNPSSYLFDSNKELLTYCYWGSCTNSLKMPSIDAGIIYVIKNIFELFLVISVLLSPVFLVLFLIYK